MNKKVNLTIMTFFIQNCEKSRQNCKIYRSIF